MNSYFTINYFYNGFLFYLTLFLQSILLLEILFYQNFLQLTFAMELSQSIFFTIDTFYHTYIFLRSTLHPFLQ